MTAPCPICPVREDLRADRYFRYGESRDVNEHGLLGHTRFAQLVWELGIYREDNPDEWREAQRVTRLPKGARR